MPTRWCLLALILVHVQVLSAQVNRSHFRQLSESEQFIYADAHCVKHWFDFYDLKKRTAAITDYRVMQEEAKGQKTICLLRLFWFRNQLDGHLTANVTQAQQALANLDSLLDYIHGHQPDLLIEKVICQLEWCMAMLGHKSRMDERTRRILVYDVAVECLVVLEKQPASALHPYYGVFDIDYHLLCMSTYFLRINEIELAKRMSLLCHRLAHPVLSSKKGHKRDYYYYKWISSINLGACYLQEGNVTEALGWYQKAYDLGKEQPSEIREAVAGGYMGSVLHKQGKTTLAVAPLQRAVLVARKVTDTESEYNAIAPLADVYLALSQYEKAFYTLKRAITLYQTLTSRVIGKPDSIDMAPLFAGLGDVYQHRGDVRKALFYSQLANRLEKRRRQNDDTRIFRRKQEKIEADVYRARVNQLNADRGQAVWLRNVAIGTLGLLVVLSAVYLSYQHKRRRAAEHKLALIDQEARTQTEQFTQVQQSQKAATKSIPDKTLPQIAELMELAILTEADWERFRQLFDQVYPNYLLRLRQKHATLTPAEIRIICLSRLALSTKEMADMLGVSTDTVVKTRYRIRRKTNLPEGTYLSHAFANV